MVLCAAIEMERPVKPVILKLKTAFLPFALVLRRPRAAAPVVVVDMPLVAFVAVPLNALISLVVFVADTQLLDPLLPFR